MKKLLSAALLALSFNSYSVKADESYQEKDCCPVSDADLEDTAGFYALSVSDNDSIENLEKLDIKIFLYEVFDIKRECALLINSNLQTIDELTGEYNFVPFDTIGIGAKYDFYGKDFILDVQQVNGGEQYLKNRNFKDGVIPGFSKLEIFVGGFDFPNKKITGEISFYFMRTPQLGEAESCIKTGDCFNRSYINFTINLEECLGNCAGKYELP